MRDIYTGTNKEIYNLDVYCGQTMIDKYDGGYRFYSLLFNAFIYVEEDMSNPMFVKALEIVQKEFRSKKKVQDFADELVLTYGDHIEIMNAIRERIAVEKQISFKEGITRSQTNIRKALGI